MGKERKKVENMGNTLPKMEMNNLCWDARFDKVSSLQRNGGSNKFWH